jgi:GNAT superfamily N-acetyltransferase
VAEMDDGTVAAAVVINAQCNADCQADYDAAAWQGGDPYLLVHRLCVSPTAQGKGVGRELMLAVEAWACTRGYTDIRLDAFSKNPHALHMYDRLGYAKRGEATWRKGLFYLLEKQLK